MPNSSLKELDLAALRHDLPAYGLVAGDIGTIVFVYEDGQAFEVEFIAEDGRTVAVETLNADEVRPVKALQKRLS